MTFKLKCMLALPTLLMLFLAAPIQADVQTGAVTINPAPSQRQILKVTAAVKKIENNTLYLQSGKKYDLRDVSVHYAKSAKGKAHSPSGKMADMLFINDVLMEVSIY
jgi:hypothetical protein